MFRFTCHPDGGEKFESVARSRAISAWEKAPGQPKGSHRSVGDLTKNFEMAEMVDLAWYAASRAGQTRLDIVEWRDQVDVELEKYDEDDEEVGPTPATP